MKQVRLILVCLLLAGGFFLTGCATTSEPENMSERPWNAPKSWEHGMPTGMMPQY